MRDGRTRRLDTRARDRDVESYLRRYDVRLVVVAGDGAGTEYRLASGRQVLGRGPGVDLAVEDPAMSRQHAAIEYDGRTFRVRDLGSTNGINVNGRSVQVHELSPGDRIEIGSLVFQYVVEARELEPDVYELTPEG